MSGLAFSNAEMSALPVAMESSPLVVRKVISTLPSAESPPVAPEQPARARAARPTPATMVVVRRGVMIADTAYLLVRGRVRVLRPMRRLGTQVRDRV
ncbi:hypothetical protein HR12_45200 [Microbacterium sp. SUBG005]|nr:hypothetical protein HR12_45200 [Microbacterium sp. SUBG005]